MALSEKLGGGVTVVDVRTWNEDKLNALSSARRRGLLGGNRDVDYVAQLAETILSVGADDKEDFEVRLNQADIDFMKSAIKEVQDS